MPDYEGEIRDYLFHCAAGVSVASILIDFENITNTLRDAEKVKPDVDNIMEVYQKENSIQLMIIN